jgi:hypothetical protein
VAELGIDVLVVEDLHHLAADRGLRRVHLLHRDQHLRGVVAGQLGHVRVGQEMHRGPH